MDIFQNGDVFSTSTDPVIDLTSKLITANIYPPKSQIKRQKMIYHCKFGEFGVMEGQFTEPSGVAINAQNDIIVADPSANAPARKRQGWVSVSAANGMLGSTSAG